MLYGEIFKEFAREGVRNLAVVGGNFFGEFGGDGERNLVGARVEGLNALCDAGGEIKVREGGFVKEGEGE